MKFGNFINRIVLVFNIIMAALLVLSGISVYISPAKYWVFAFFTIAFPYFLLANIFFIIFWLIQWNRWLLISLFSIIFNINHICSIFQLPKLFPDFSRNTEKVQEIKVLSYNVKALNRYESKKPLVHFKEVVALIKKKNPDIICFQEYFLYRKGEQSINSLLKGLAPNSYSYTFYNYASKRNQGDGLLILSKYPIVKKQKIDFQKSSNAAMYIDVNINGKYTRVFNVHLQSLKFIKENYDYLDTLDFTYNHQNRTAVKKISLKLRNAFVMRASQADHLSGLISQSPYPVIICGDFNDTPVSYTYYKMKKNHRDAFQEAGSGLGLTYHGMAPSFRIDYILFSKSYKALTYETININYSDHYPIVSSLYIKEKK